MTAVARYKLPADLSTSGQVSHTYYVNAADGRRKVVETWAARRLLGKGGYGTVRLEERIRGTGPIDKRAVKVIDKTFTNGQRREIEALVQLVQLIREHRESFVRFYGWFEDAGAIYIAMEYCPLGDLRKYISNLQEREAQVISIHILKGIRVLHGTGIAHRDLKPENLLVQSLGPHWVVKITDFGLAKDEYLLATADRGTPGYMAPEILPNTPYTSAVDMWSLGCIIYEMLFARRPFDPRYPRVLAEYCRTGELPPAPPERQNVSQEAIKLVRSLLHPNADLRPSAEWALASSDWLQGSFSMNFSGNKTYNDGSSSSSQRGSATTHNTARATTQDSGRHSIYTSAGTNTKPQEDSALEEASNLIAQGSRLVPRLYSQRAVAEARSSEARRLFMQAISWLESITDTDPQSRLGKFRRLTYVSLELTYVSVINEHEKHVRDAESYNRQAQRAAEDIGTATSSTREEARDAQSKVKLDRAKICMRHGRIKQKQSASRQYLYSDVDSRSATNLLTEAFRIYEMLASLNESNGTSAAECDLRAQALQGCGEVVQIMLKTADGVHEHGRNGLDQPGAYFKRALKAVDEGLTVSGISEEMAGALQHTAGCVKVASKQSGSSSDLRR